MEKIPVAAVVGPTASGKTALSVELALRFNGEVVSADSMQIYKGLPIGTAQPPGEEMRGIPHHLIGFLEPSETFSVADYAAAASRCIREIRGRGRLPIVTGGTGLYIRSLLSNLSFAPQGRDESLREKLYRKAEALGSGALVEELESFDPESAQRIHPNNVSRLVRAIEIYRMTGVTMSEQIRRSRRSPSPYDACMLGLDFRDRQTLYQRINLRVDQMMKHGLLEEARWVYTQNNSPTAMQAIGYKEFFPYFRSECGLVEAVEQVKRESRRYAKRQLTWFRRESDIQWIILDENTDAQSVAAQAARILETKGWGKTI